MMDITKSQSDFEAWWNAPEQAELRNSCAMGWGFRIWKASRESIEVELPEYQAEDYYQNAGYNAAIDDCSSILRTAGIRIKGESE
ncbi:MULTISPECIES: hypothetical protein [Yersinia]|uniref:hypothetical protein n=1 Tax=Yersinia TaxID=629 RepID=UPI0005E06C38|nr:MULTISPECIES: hypothetical protein [Yersinia]CNI92143.1 Uncharacterised protein [Yersinia intermedia]CNK94944.1 Uncharacterised protein [Yersinia frederiksenii]CNL70659.1 Uncharacterised protein [Yersinia frederiksenii]